MIKNKGSERQENLEKKNSNYRDETEKTSQKNLY